MTEKAGQSVVRARRFGTDVGQMQPEALAFACEMVERYGIEDDLQLYEVFEGAAAGFEESDLRQLLSLQAREGAQL
jgi:hypothetical protein